MKIFFKYVMLIEKHRGSKKINRNDREAKTDSYNTEERLFDKVEENEVELFTLVGH